MSIPDFPWKFLSNVHGKEVLTIARSFVNKFHNKYKTIAAGHGESVADAKCVKAELCAGVDPTAAGLIQPLFLLVTEPLLAPAARDKVAQDLHRRP